MKILLFGGSGQLGFELEKRARDLNFEIVSPVFSEVDISNRDQVLFLTARVKPNLVINSAAYTAVDKAEAEPEEAFRINRDGAGIVAEAAREMDCKLIHVSTDYVFDGTGNVPLNEDAVPNPQSVYGKSKREGEEAVLSAHGDRSVVVRTSSLHGQKGINFVHTMLDLFASRPSLKIVSDQLMSPTWAGWLSEVILDLGRLPYTGLLHASCAGAVSWFDFAEEIRKLATPRIPQAANVVLEPISAKEFGRPAPRPGYSVFDCSRLASIIGRKPIAWQVGLKNHLSDIGYLEIG